ncbi:LLM class flavin-dependent oxidoreductase [Myxococcota bacterium]|nr:LLM class flavin-dependent oxidoreductase [Myxococcota bacterium]
MFTFRFDMRSPATSPASTTDLYQAALDMASWGEEHGVVSMMVSEHHHASDGYLPSPLVLASALAARTREVPIQVGALLAPLHDPIRLAEDIAVLDNLSRGRVAYILAVGYRPEEYAMLGRDYSKRGQLMDECIEAMRQAWSGEAFTYQGRPVLMATRTMTPGGPTLFMGGHSKPAVRRAARYGMGVMTEGNTGLEEFYKAECANYGTEPQMFVDPGPGTVSSAFIAEDPDAAWEEYGPHLLHDALMYAEWMGEHQQAITHSASATVEALKAEQGNYRIFTPDEAVAYVREHGLLSLQPLCGGLPPDLAWKSLELLAAKVLPQLG